MTKLTASYYDGLKRAVEHPDDPKPVSVPAIRARRRAIAEGRLKAPSRDELARIESGLEAKRAAAKKAAKEAAAKIAAEEEAARKAAEDAANEEAERAAEETAAEVQDAKDAEEAEAAKLLED